MQNNQKGKLSIKFVAYTGLMTAIVYVCTLIGVSTPVANFNIGDSAILITAAMFNPLTAMIAGGLGAFLADLTTFLQQCSIRWLSRQSKVLWRA